MRPLPSSRAIWPIQLALLFLLAGQVGCQTARFVRKDGNGGEVAIPHNSNSWPYYNRDQAQKLMAEHFPEGYEVEAEQEAVIGQKTDYSENGTGAGVPIRLGRNVGLGVGVGSKSGTATTTNKTEWRYRYRRKNAPQNAPQAGGTSVPSAAVPDLNIEDSTGQSSTEKETLVKPPG